MSFVDAIFEQLERSPDAPAISWSTPTGVQSWSRRELLEHAAAARRFLERFKLAAGDRVVVVAPNSPTWIALDLALLSEGVLSVPLYARQTPDEIAHVIRDATPRLVVAGAALMPALRDKVSARGDNVTPPPLLSLEEIFEPSPVAPAPSAEAAASIGAATSREASASRAAPNSRATPDFRATPDSRPRVDLDEKSPVTIRYTSGTSGEPKGVVLHRANLDHMLGCTCGRLDVLLRDVPSPWRIFHYLPFCFAGSWMLLLSALTRGAHLFLGLDATRIAADLALAKPHTSLNVPLLLERIRSGIDERIRARGGWIAPLFERACRAALAEGASPWADRLALAVAQRILFPPIRKKLGPDLRALICGSAPLARETQLFFEMLGLPVLQVYGLTETTAICTMDEPGKQRPGWVGPAIANVEVRLSSEGEILVRGPNLFAGYWNRPEATNIAFQDGWYRTGDRGEIDENGRWRILGRVKNVLVLSSGHNVAPEPLEEVLREKLPEARHVIVVGHGRPHLGALVSGTLSPPRVQDVLDHMNQSVPHFQRIRSYTMVPDPDALEKRCFTANGKLRRDSLPREFPEILETLYAESPS